MKSLIFITFILSPILISAQTYDFYNVTTPLLDLKNEDESGKVIHPKYYKNLCSGTKNEFCLLGYFDPKKHTIKHFNVHQLFSADPIMYKNSNFIFFFILKIDTLKSRIL